MKRLRRWVLNAMTVLSLLLCLAVAGVWVRSYWRCDWAGYFSADRLIWCDVATPPGIVDFALVRGRWAGTPKFDSGFHHGSDAPEDTRQVSFAFLGLGWKWQQLTNPNPGGLRLVAEAYIHDAYVLALFAALPAFRLFRRLTRHRRFGPGHCRRCGYDLRATPDRCPECGAIPPAAARG